MLFASTAPAASIGLGATTARPATARWAAASSNPARSSSTHAAANASGVRGDRAEDISLCTGGGLRTTSGGRAPAASPGPYPFR